MKKGITNMNGKAVKIEGHQYDVNFVSNLLKLSKVAVRHYPKRYNIGKIIGRNWYFSKSDIIIIYDRMKESKKKKINKTNIENLLE